MNISWISWISWTLCLCVCSGASWDAFLEVMQSNPRSRSNIGPGVCQFVILSKDKNCVQSWLSGYCRDLRQETMEKIIENVNWKHAKLTRKGGIGAIGGRATHPSGGSIHLLFHSLQRTVPETPEHIAAAASTGCSMHRWHTPVKEQRSCSSCNLQHNTWHSRVTWQNCRSLRTLDSKLGVLASLFLKTIRKTKSVNESSARLGWNHVEIATTKWPITRARRCTASNLDLSLSLQSIIGIQSGLSRKKWSQGSQVQSRPYDQYEYEEAAVLVRERANRAVQKVPNECCLELPPAQARKSVWKIQSPKQQSFFWWENHSMLWLELSSCCACFSNSLSCFSFAASCSLWPKQATQAFSIVVCASRISCLQCHCLLAEQLFCCLRSKSSSRRSCLKTLKIVATADDHRVLHLGVAATSTTLPLPGAPSDDCCHWVGLLAGPRWPGSKRESETGECGF